MNQCCAPKTSFAGRSIRLPQQSEGAVGVVVTTLRTRVREGVALNQAVAERGFFHPLFAQLVAVGEESGRLQLT